MVKMHAIHFPDHTGQHVCQGGSDKAAGNGISLTEAQREPML